VNYIRFVVPQRHEDSGQRAGVFSIAYHLMDQEETPTKDKQHLRGILDWFKKNLTVPEKCTIPPRAVFWYKKNANETIQKMWSLCGILRDHGYHPQMIRIGTPGKIVYEDDKQVGAVPFKRV
jgi:hypothetical protein